MKTEFLYYPAFIFTLLFAIQSSAQDSILTKTDIIQAKIIEVGIDDIKYNLFNSHKDSLLIISKKEIIQINFQNGAVSKYKSPSKKKKVPLDTLNQYKTHALKLGLWEQVTTNFILFSYEQILKPGINLELKLGFPGLGFGANSKYWSGFIIKGGPKFLVKSKSRSHIISRNDFVGFFIKPEIAYGNYKFEYYTRTTRALTKNQYSNLGINLIFGYEQLTSSMVIIDFYAGFGYAKEFSHSSPKLSLADIQSGQFTNHRFYLDDDLSFNISSGISLGLIF